MIITNRARKLSPQMWSHRWHNQENAERRMRNDRERLKRERRQYFRQWDGELREEIRDEFFKKAMRMQHKYEQIVTKLREALDYQRA